MLYGVAAPRAWPQLELPARGSRLGQASVGAAMGADIHLDTLTELAGNALPIAGVCLATLLSSLLVGKVFAAVGRVSEATGVFAMVAGGASGITAVSRELGADDRVVSVVQYLRVVLILVGMPIVTTLVFSPSRGGGAATVTRGAGLGPDLLFTAIAVAGGLSLARVVSFPSSSLLMPLFVAMLVSLSGVLGPVAEPPLLQAVGFALIGAQVGLRFTAESLRRIARLLPLALACILGLVAACAGFGVAIASWTHRTPLDGYLATTPGGLYAVLATAVDSGADVTFVLAMQVIRLVVVLATAPLLAAWLRRRAGR